ncbi:MAG: hypothetical protein HY695_29865 [Deltaproteobacteria bacterium]|nr:hypothetical protein [Deltaproteobacteria bacterium]
MTTKPHDRLHAKLDRLEAARRSARAKTSQVLSQAISNLSERALSQRQRAAQKAIQEALGKTHGVRDAREIAFHLSEWFEEAAFLVALQLDPARFSKAEIKAGVSDVLACVLDHVWEAVRVAGGPLPCLDDETLDGNDNEDR